MKQHLIPEWAPQASTLIVLPPKESDWKPIYHDVLSCYKELIHHISHYQPVTITHSEPKPPETFPHNNNTDYLQIPTNDTWVRDFGPITVREKSGTLRFLDFGFNAWGLKFAADCDNLFTRRLVEKRFFNYAHESMALILEGGGIEYDGCGTLMVTSECLLNPNRNPHLSKEVLEKQLYTLFGLQKILWLDHGYLAGDDTDSHIDTLARFISPTTIMYVQCLDPEDEHFHALQTMEQQLKHFTNAQGEPYTLIPLPMTRPIYDHEGNRLPATYANFLFINGALLYPTYDDPADVMVHEIFSHAIPNRDIIPIPCRVLIEQHGSLHCSTMQIPK